MSAQHTPGPWLCTKAKHGVDAGHYVIATVADDRGDRCLIIHAEVGDDSQVEGNVNLVLAAQDLLAVAEAALWEDDGLHCADALRAAIAKAKGEQP
ncbi:MAG: hypothetical protein ACN6PJ_15740 [Achromobacter sp.]|uniref:hypothetical protein n=1 Tax=Achromobacter sp. TaxID=134375 RepID=UPI003D05D399